jgi:hypothetical protein
MVGAVGEQFFRGKVPGCSGCQSESARECGIYNTDITTEFAAIYSASAEAPPPPDASRASFVTASLRRWDLSM